MGDAAVRAAATASLLSQTKILTCVYVCNTLCVPSETALRVLPARDALHPERLAAPTSSRLLVCRRRLHRSLGPNTWRRRENCSGHGLEDLFDIDGRFRARLEELYAQLLRNLRRLQGQIRASKSTGREPPSNSERERAACCSPSLSQQRAPPLSRTCCRPASSRRRRSRTARSRTASA